MEEVPPPPTPPLAPSSPTSDVAVALRTEGNGFFQHGDFARAAEKYTDAIAADPSAFEAIVNRSVVYCELGLHLYALMDAEAAMALAPTHEHSFSRKAAALIGLERFEEAASTCWDGLQALPESAKLKDLMATATRGASAKASAGALALPSQPSYSLRLRTVDEHTDMTSVIEFAQELIQNVETVEAAIVLLERVKSNVALQGLHCRMLGAAYRKRINGDTVENLRFSILYFARSIELLSNPLQCARVMVHLADVYADPIIRSLGKNVESAINCYRSALGILTLEQQPFEFASAHLKVALLHMSAGYGAKVDHIEAAIASFGTALSVLSPDQFPLENATAESALGDAYTSRTHGERSANVDSAIRHYERAVAVTTRFSDLVALFTSLGELYWMRTHGDRAADVDASIEYFKKALDLVSREQIGTLVQIANLRMKAGMAYMKAIHGSRASNVDTALGYFEAAAAHLESPSDCAKIARSLGLAYSERIVGPRSDNIERAIAAFEHAVELMVGEAKAATKAGVLASVLLNLGKLYMDRVEGSREHNVEIAISKYVAAERVLAAGGLPLVHAHMNLAAAYSARLAGDSEQNNETAISLFTNALSAMNSSTHPVERASTQMALGIAYLARRRGASVANLELAFALYQKALRILSFDSDPYGHMRVLSSLCSALLPLSTDRALEIAQFAVSAMDSLSGSVMVSPRLRLQLDEVFHGVLDVAVVALCRVGRFETAWAHAAQSKIPFVYGEHTVFTEPAIQTLFEELQSNLAAAQLGNRWPTDAWLDRIDFMRRAIVAFLATHQQHRNPNLTASSPGHHATPAAFVSKHNLRGTDVAVEWYWCESTSELYAFVLNARGEVSTRVSRMDIDTLAFLTAALETAQLTLPAEGVLNFARLIGLLSGATDVLAQVAATSPRVVILPHRWLGSLPWASLALSGLNPVSVSQVRARMAQDVEIYLALRGVGCKNGVSKEVVSRTNEDIVASGLFAGCTTLGQSTGCQFDVRS